MRTDAPLKAWLPYFLGVSTAWGASFLLISIGLRAFSPTQVAWGRVAVGAVTLMVLVVVTRNFPQLTWRKVGAVAVVAAFMSGIPLVLIPAAQQHISSILASLLNATTPLWTALFVALVIPSERVSRQQLVGLIIGALGIATLLGAWRVADFPVVGAALMLAATACYGIGSTMSRVLLGRVKDSPTALSCMQMSLSALILAPVVLAGPGVAQGAVELDSVAMWAIVALGVTGTSFAYVWFWKVIKVAGATTASSVTYVVPVVATVLGVVVLGESLTWYEVVGALIVFSGVWLAQRTPRPRPLVAEEVKGTPA